MYYTQKQLEELLEEIKKRIAEVKWEDICLAGSWVYGLPRLRFVNLDDTSIAYPSDLDAIVWITENLGDTKRMSKKFVWNNVVVCLVFKFKGQKHDSVGGYKMPQYSLITNQMFDYDQQEINAFIQHKNPIWLIGREKTE